MLLKRRLGSSEKYKTARAFGSNAVAFDIKFFIVTVFAVGRTMDSDGSQ